MNTPLTLYYTALGYLQATGKADLTSHALEAVEAIYMTGDSLQSASAELEDFLEEHYPKRPFANTQYEKTVMELAD